MQNSIKIKEFSLLCGTTKDTLLHYDEIGLLIAHRDNQGRRLYQREQFFDYELIQLLKGTGASLEDIKKLFEEQKLDNLQNFFSEKLEALKKEELLAKKRRKSLEHLVTSIKEVRSPLVNKVTTSLFDWSCLDFQTIVNYKQGFPSVEEYIQFVRKPERRKIGTPAQIGLALHLEDFLELNFAPYAFVKKKRSKCQMPLEPTVDLITTVSLEQNSLDLSECKDLLLRFGAKIIEPIIIWEVLPFLEVNAKWYIRLSAKIAQ